MSCVRVSLPLLILALSVGCVAATSEGETGEAGETSATDGDGDGDGDGEGDGDGDGEGDGDGDGDGDEPAEPASFFGDRPLNIAHRGGRFEFPEHTLVAYEGALSVGADVLELDVRLSADQHLVVLHDSSVDRTTDGVGAVSELSLAQLSALDAGYSFTLDEGQTYPYRGMGLTIPTLDEVFEAFPNELYVIEIKPEDPAATEALVAALEGRDKQKHLVSSSAEGVTEYLRSLDATIMTGMTVAEVFAFVSVTPETEADYEAPTPFMQVPLEYGPLQVLDAYRVELAEAKGIKVHAFTINDAEVMQMLLGWGVHGIMTDLPSLLRELIDAQP